MVLWTAELYIVWRLMLFAGSLVDSVHFTRDCWALGYRNALLGLAQGRSSYDLAAITYGAAYIDDE